MSVILSRRVFLVSSGAILATRAFAADKIKPAELAKVVEATTKAVSKRPAAFPRVAATSSEKGTGLAELRAEIAEAAAI